MYIKVNDKYQSVREYRDMAHPLENTMQYADEVILPILSAMPSSVTIRCRDSGVPIGYITANELHDCMKAAVIDTKFTRMDDLGYKVTEFDLVSSIEAIIDQVEIKMILMRPQSPSFAFVHGSSVKHVAMPAKQLCMLLNQFLFDPGHLSHNHYQNIELEIAEAKRLGVMADEILDYFALDSEVAQATLESLIELDAKYRIVKLQFRQSEHDELLAIKANAGKVNTEQMLLSINHLAVNMIQWRDVQQVGIYSGRADWTNTAYRNQMTDMERTSRRRSNVLIAEAKPKTTIQREKEKREADMRESIFSVFSQRS